jgi:hypothetical protein
MSELLAIKVSITLCSALQCGFGLWCLCKPRRVLAWTLRIRQKYQFLRGPGHVTRLRVSKPYLWYIRAWGIGATMMGLLQIYCFLFVPFSS